MKKDNKVTIESIASEMCPECGGHLFAVVGDRTVLVMCFNHKNAFKYDHTGTGKCGYQFVQDRASYYFRR